MPIKGKQVCAVVSGGTINGNKEDFRIVESSAFGNNNISNKSNGQHRIDATSSFGGINLYFDDE